MAQLLAQRRKLLGTSPLFYDEPIHLVKGEGVWLYDVDGKQYLDAYNNVPSVGHCHPRVVRALASQAATLNTHTRYLHETIVEYAKELTSLFDDTLNMVYFLCSGSEANELALRVVRESTGKEGIISSDYSYHGNTRAVYDLASSKHTTSPNKAVKYVPFPETYRPIHQVSGEALADAYTQNIVNAIKDLEQEGTGFAAVLFCPILANEALPNVPKGFWLKLKNTVKDAGGYIIFDEVQSGFGRTGKLWGQDWTGIVPDIVTLGKPMGNGHPVAGLVARDDIIHQFQDKVSYFNTFGGNPVSCAVGLSVLEVIREEKLLENAAQTGQYLYEGICSLQDRFDIIGDVRAKGLFVGVELVKDRESKDAFREAAKQIVNGLRANGVLLSRAGRYSNVLKIRPPLVFSKDNADLLLDKLESALTSL